MNILPSCPVHAFAHQKKEISHRCPYLCNINTRIKRVHPTTSRRKKRDQPFVMDFLWGSVVFVHFILNSVVPGYPSVF
ncbi:unnamed protein product [Linum tenue]|uniref:Uncharacterized protein n=1 Tax=Linum tenue TaxID=586396 RepID=A0AAV0MZ14_9ROSI|nr:unnamed protein product [Linum tenue]